MRSQHIGVGLSDRREFASLTPHAAYVSAYPFISSAFSATFRLGYSQDTSFPTGGPNKGQAGSNGLVDQEKKTRRIGCPRASKSWSHSASQRLSQLVHSKQKKSTWSLTLHQSLLSRPTPASTNNFIWGQPRVASKTTSFDLNRTIRSSGNSHKILDATANFSFNWSIRNNEGEKKCAYTSRPSPLCTLSHPADRQNPKRSPRNQGTINSEIMNVTSSRAPTPVCRTTTPVSCQTAPLRPRASSAHRQGVAMTAARRVVAVRQAHQDAHKGKFEQIRRPSGQTFGSEGASC